MFDNKFNEFDKDLLIQEVNRAKENLNHYRDIVQSMVLPIKNGLDNYFDSRPAIERAYFYGLLKAINELAKKMNEKINFYSETPLSQWQKYNKDFESYLTNFQSVLAKIGYNVDLSEGNIKD